MLNDPKEWDKAYAEAIKHAVATGDMKPLAILLRAQKPMSRATRNRLAAMIENGEFIRIH